MLFFKESLKEAAIVSAVRDIKLVFLSNFKELKARTLKKLVEFDKLKKIKKLDAMYFFL